MHISSVRSPYTKTAWFYTATRIEAGRDHIFSQVDEEKHMKRRQQMAAGYSGKENPNLEPTIDNYIHQLISLIRAKYLSSTTHSTPLDLAHKIQFLTLDVISDIGFGQAFGDLAADKDVDGYIAASENTVFFIVILCATGLMPVLQWPPLARIIGPSEGGKSANPRVYAKLQREIDETVASGQAPGVVPDAVAKDLAYLQAVLREGFRMRPPVTDVVPKKVPAGGDTVVVDGESVFLPGGTNIGYSVNGLHSRKDIFGQDADIFRPERWIPSGNGEDAERVAEMKKTTELIFGYGKYQCLGKNIGWMEYGKAIFELFRHFDVAFADPQDPWKEKNYLGIFASQGLWVLATERGVRV
ncbi:hypothetical protein GRF29_44g2335980 [Pseudopithomyces chartarum]|uniref:Pisatin demethylase n=1 Tax=Pseudopithomyces chartarum TaxID=1892770 RepID=A0AAN6M316_9PLEO|nr:hypothetical protein GRF29_44g2335980 [Pseudopithomyces chartarum]